MKKFSFNLEPVLNHRKLLEEREEQKLVRIHQAILQAQQLREEIRQEMAECRLLIAKHQRGVIDIDKVRHLARYIEKLEMDLVQISQTLKRLEMERNRQLEVLVEVRKQREVVDKLKERSFATYERETKELEQKLLDELSVVQFKHQATQNLPGKKTDS